MGLGTAPVGGPGGRVFARAGAGSWFEGEADDAGTGGELRGPENTERSRPVMAPCSPRVEVTLADWRQACLRRRHIEIPPQARPARAMAYVDGSGTTAKTPVF